LEYGGLTPFSTTSVQRSPGTRLRDYHVCVLGCGHSASHSGTEAVENGVEPPYSI